MEPLNERQFGKVANLADWRSGRPARRQVESRMTTNELHQHILDEHGVMPASDRPLTKGYLEMFHGDLHQAGSDVAPPTVPHTHTVQSH